MALSLKSTPNEVLRVVIELTPENIDNNLQQQQRSAGCETWTCAFSPDNKLFAWSSGHRIFNLVPTQHFTLNKNAKTLTLQENLFQLTIDCCHLIRSLNFVTLPNLKQSTSFWARLAKCKDLFLVTGHNNGRIRVWDVVECRLLLELLDHKDSVSDLAASPNGSGLLASTSFDGTIKIWDLMRDGKLQKTLKTDSKPIYGLSWSRDSNRLATVGMSKVAIIWDTSTYKIALELSGHQHNVVGCDYSPDGCLIATASWDTRVIIWDSMTGNKLREFFHLNPPPRLIYASGENGNWIRSISFSPDGAHLATVADDGLVRIWDIFKDSPEATGTIEGGICCNYSPSGQLLAVGTRTGTVKLFEAKSCVKSLQFLCRSAIRRNLPLDTQFSSEFIPVLLIGYLLYKEWVDELKD